MKAVVHTRYGSPDVLQLKEVEQPTPKDNELLIRVHATTVNRTDCGFRSAETFIVRFFTGLLRPKRTILGSEFAGEVVAVGKDVDLLNVGDQVFGLSGAFGTHAGYLCLPEEKSVATMPANLTYEEAAAHCDGAMLALRDLREAHIRSGQKVLVYGASGAVGTAAVQLAKYFGADVAGVCGTRNLDLVKSLGADEVIDYTKGDFTKHGQMYDVVFDAVGQSSFGRCKKLLKQSGIYIATDLGFLFQNPFYALWTSKIGSIGGKKVIFPVLKHSKEEILFFKELLETGTFRPVIDRCYRLDQIVEASRYVETGRKTGNVVITVEHDA